VDAVMVLGTPAVKNMQQDRPGNAAGATVKKDYWRPPTWPCKTSRRDNIRQTGDGAQYQTEHDL